MSNLILETSESTKSKMLVKTRAGQSVRLVFSDLENLEYGINIFQKNMKRTYWISNSIKGIPPYYPPTPFLPVPIPGWEVLNIHTAAITNLILVRKREVLTFAKSSNHAPFAKRCCPHHHPIPAFCGEDMLGSEIIWKNLSIYEQGVWRESARGFGGLRRSREGGARRRSWVRKEEEKKQEKEDREAEEEEA